MKMRMAQILVLSVAVGSPLLAQQPPTDARPGQPPPTRPVAPMPQPDKAGASEKSGLSGADKQFVMHAAEGGQAEVALAKLAQQKASNAEVKSFAERLERDHSQANDELKSLASQKQITLAEKPSAAAAKLEKLSGAAFDKAYITAMVSDHQKDVRAFERQAEHGADAEIKAFASKTLPTLKEHLQQAEQLAKTVGGKAGS